MATGTIDNPTGYSDYADITSSWVTQSYYSRLNDSKVEWSRSGNVVIATVTATCNEPYNTYPGITVATGLPLPKALIVENYPSFTSDEAGLPLWARVETNGDLHLRNGVAGRGYNVAFIYICK